MRYIILFLFLMVASPAFAQDVEKVKEAVPAEIFNWIMAGVTVIILALAGVIVVLYRAKGTGMTAEQAAMLQKVHDTFLPLIGQLQEEQKGRREDIERLLGEQKEVFIKGLELTGKLPPLMSDLKSLLVKVETLLKRQG